VEAAGIAGLGSKAALTPSSTKSRRAAAPITDVEASPRLAWNGPGILSLLAHVAVA
jgi:hypothetical protein